MPKPVVEVKSGRGEEVTHVDIRAEGLREGWRKHLSHEALGSLAKSSPNLDCDKHGVFLKHARAQTHTHTHARIAHTTTHHPGPPLTYADAPDTRMTYEPALLWFTWVGCVSAAVTVRVWGPCTDGRMRGGTHKRGRGCESRRARAVVGLPPPLCVCGGPR